MRSKEEVMEDAKKDVTTALMMEYVIEVLLDIRDNMGPRITMKPEDKNEE